MSRINAAQEWVDANLSTVMSDGGRFVLVDVGNERSGDDYYEYRVSLTPDAARELGQRLLDLADEAEE